MRINNEISIEEIKLLHLIYIHGSITKASISAGMTQSSLSKKLKAIENKLEVTFFKRSTRKLTVTPIGLEFLENTSSIPKTIETAIHALQDSICQAPPYIKLDLANSLSNAHIPGFIRKQDVITDINLRVAQHSQQVIIKRLETCKTDVAILPHTHELDRIAIIHQLIDDQFILLTSSSSEIPSMKHSQKWATLQKWILPDRNDITHHQIKSWLRQENVECNTTMEIPNFDLINHLVALGHGVAIVPKRSLRLFYNKKLLRTIKLDVAYSRKIAIVSPLEAPNKSKINHFLNSIAFS